ncbi:uncharacterized protein LOC120341071 [Styela clava]
MARMAGASPKSDLTWVSFHQSDSQQDANKAMNAAKTNIGMLKNASLETRSADVAAWEKIVINRNCDVFQVLNKRSTRQKKLSESLLSRYGSNKFISFKNKN